jgi:hypothetical protein
MNKKNWLPTKEDELVDLQEKWYEDLPKASLQTAYGWNATECSETVVKIGAFLAARKAYKDVDSSANRLDKDEKKAKSIKAMRDFANSSIRFNKKMTDAQKLRYGISAPDDTKTSHGVPAHQPETEVQNTKNRFEHRVSAINVDTRTAVKPDDAYGVRYGWQIGGARPATGADLPKSRFRRKASIVITHTEASKGETVYYATCYENAKGDTGPWSPIVDAVNG